jgi:ABC-type amino acid transport substrate-binding protein
MRPLHKLNTTIISVAMLLGPRAWCRAMTISTPDWPPFYIHDSDDTDARGLAWDVLRICSVKNNVNPIYEMYPIRRMFKYMENGDLDLNIMSYKSDRAKALAYGSEVVFENTYGIWTRASLRNKVTSLADITHLSIAQLIGLRPSDEVKALLEARLKNPQSQETLILNDPDQVVKMLATDRIDATVSSVAEIKWRATKLHVANKLRFTGVVVQRQKYFFVMSRQSPLFLQQPQILKGFDQCVRDLKRSGVWSRLQQKYQNQSTSPR